MKNYYIVEPEKEYYIGWKTVFIIALFVCPLLFLFFLFIISLGF